MAMTREPHHDVVIVGGGHNGLTAAAYLARAGLRVTVLERLDHLGGAAVSAMPFPGVDVQLSRYAYLVSLLPDALASDLGLRLRLASRRVSSYTPTNRRGRAEGLFIGRGDGLAARTEASFVEVTGSSLEHQRFCALQDDLERLAAVVAPTLLEPLPTAAELRRRLGDDALWDEVIERPLSQLLEHRFADDLVRGIVLTDGLIGTFARADASSRAQNACFLYHVIGNGTGEWRVPVGGMATVVDELARVAREAGAELVTGAEVTGLVADGTSAELTVRDVDTGRLHTVAARWVLVNAAPATLHRITGQAAGDQVDGCQVKVNLVVQRLPRFRSGVDPADGFAGTLHIDEGYAQLDRAYDQAVAGQLPDPLPAELYCHSLTDPSIFSASLRAMGWHTLTAFVLHTPADLFRHDAADDDVVARLFAGLDAHLESPIAECIARDREGRPCIEVANPLELEASLGLPGGNIFHGPLRMPFVESPGMAGAPGDEPAARWGVQTAQANVLLCGSGSVRGGAVSGLGGHHAAHALLELLADRR